MSEFHNRVIQKFESENKGYKLINDGDKFYVQIDFEKVKGYNKLSDFAKTIFEKVYKMHNSVHGLDYKINWIPKSVKEHKTYLEVHFSNKDWLHYTPNGEWY